MPEPPDLDELAQRYLDLWQDQLAELAGDDGVAEVMARTIELMTSGAWAFSTLAGAKRSEGGGADDTDTGGRTAVATAAGAAHGHTDGGVAELARRLAVLEGRIAALEGGPGATRGRTQGRGTKRRS